MIPIPSLTSAGFISFGFAQVLNPHTDTKVTGVTWRLEIAVEFWALFWVGGHLEMEKRSSGKMAKEPQKKGIQEKKTWLVAKN